MLKIFKYAVPIEDSVALIVPKDFCGLSFGEQSGGLVTWGVVDPDIQQTELLRLVIRGTGHPFRGNEGRFIQTVQMSNGLVWHIFEEKLDHAT